jgi:asparagine synthase (glutamine-hydrolysing)
MCGIAGILHWGTQSEAGMLTSRMANAMRHRGPDDDGRWFDDDVALGFVRLSIVDLDGGAQPMRSADDATIVVFNGEIYNHRKLREQLEDLGHVFQSDHSDTEVLVHGYREWGRGLVERLNGMFAFAIWDKNCRQLLLARDRYGIKPLYVSSPDGKMLLFASEIRALLASGKISPRPSPTALVEYLSFQNYLGTETVFEGIESFPPGTCEVITASGRRRERFWDYHFSRTRRESLDDLAVEHRVLLRNAVSRQLQADVPVMTYLSGGIDSSAIAAMAFGEAPDMRAYSCIFELDGVGEDRVVDEREFSRTMARHLSIEHFELELAGDALSANLDSVVRSLEEPRMGMSYVNYLIAERVARDGKVVLSGLGGDELHGGYLYRYQALAPWRRGSVPLQARMRNLLRGKRQPSADEAIMRLLNFPIYEDQRPVALGPELAGYTRSVDVRERLETLMADGISDDPWDRLMMFDVRAYMQGLLVLEDKLSMAHSLETRVPLLDNDLVDFLLDVPWDALCDGQTGKILFRESVRQLVPGFIADKPKMGFGPPDASWYRGPLRHWVECELSERRIRARGLLNPEFVRRVLAEHFSGARNHVALIWSFLSLESWCRVFGMYGGIID